jgi:hypothetical protein
MESSNPDYGGFWFFAFPLSILEGKIIMPFFMKADDVEFGVRLNKTGVKTLTMPGVAVQHPGFYESFDLFKRYLWVRNMLAVEMLHGDRSVLSLGFSLLRDVVIEVRKQRIYHLFALVQGLKDFREGPEWMDTANNERIHNTLTLNALKLNRNFLSFIKQASHGLLQCIAITISGSSLKKAWQHNDLASIERWKARFQQ